MTDDRIVDYISEKVIDLIKHKDTLVHLDIGCGSGYLIELLHKQYPNIQSEGCDFNPEHNQCKNLSVQKVNLNREPLPYPNEKFDLVTCTEVIEHLENYNHVIRETVRILKPGGLLLLSTPNILSIRSRLHFLTRGFYEYFDPLPLKNDKRFYAGERHINPISYFRLAHALMDSGIEEIKFSYDKQQRFSLLLYPLFKPLINYAIKNSEKTRSRKLKQLPQYIEVHATAHGTKTLLTGRTLIIWGYKRNKQTL